MLSFAAVREKDRFGPRLFRNALAKPTGCWLPAQHFFCSLRSSSCARGGLASPCCAGHDLLRKLHQKTGREGWLSVKETAPSPPIRTLASSHRASKTSRDRKTDRTVTEDIGGTLCSGIRYLGAPACRHPQSRQPYHSMLTGDCLSLLAHQEISKEAALSSPVGTEGPLPAFYGHPEPGASLAEGEGSPPQCPRADDLFSLFFPKHQISTWFDGFLAL